MTEKPVDLRVAETMEIMKSLKGLGIAMNGPEVMELREHMNAYIKDGVCWSGNIDFRAYGRVAEVELPRRADKPIVVNLRVRRLK